MLGRLALHGQYSLGCRATIVQFSVSNETRRQPGTIGDYKKAGTRHDGKMLS